MTDTLRFYTFLAIATWLAVWFAIAAVLKATQPEEEKEDEAFCAIHNLPYMSNTEVWIGLSFFWPVFVALSPFYLFIKAIYHLTKKICKQ